MGSGGQRGAGSLPSGSRAMGKLQAFTPRPTTSTLADSQALAGTLPSRLSLRNHRTYGNKTGAFKSRYARRNASLYLNAYKH
ncbi:hypothetical protein NHX12_016717 [Muraenolepis orangiensis]|nr:hypothetical protein NHX12_016717 [Muraenolepis orangiensis]